MPAKRRMIRCVRLGPRTHVLVEPLTAAVDCERPPSGWSSLRPGRAEATQPDASFRSGLSDEDFDLTRVERGEFDTSD